MVAKTRRKDCIARRTIGGPIAALAIVASLMLGSSPSIAGDLTASAENATLEIISPKDGDTVTSPVIVQFGLAGMGVAPAGVTNANTGHHHLIIDATLPNLDFAIPMDAKHRHFGGGQTQVSLELPAGEHEVQVAMTDAATRFVTPMTFEVLSGRPVATSLWDPADVWVLRFHETCIAFMLIGGATALTLALRLGFPIEDPERHADPDAIRARIRLHRRAGRTAVAAASIAFLAAAVVLYGMFARAL